MLSTILACTILLTLFSPGVLAVDAEDGGEPESVVTGGVDEGTSGVGNEPEGSEETDTGEIDDAENVITLTPPRQGERVSRSHR